LLLFFKKEDSFLFSGGFAGLFYGSLATLAAPFLRSLVRRRLARGKEIAGRLGEREGIDPTPRPAGTLIWLHAASVGETQSLLPVIGALPGGVTVLLTTGTVTSNALLEQRLPALRPAATVLHRFVPLDVPAWAARFLDHWRPDAAAMVESELWPNLVFGAARRGVPLLLLNARLSAKSFRGWRLAPRFARRLLGCFCVVQAQSDADAERLRALGAAQVSSPGNLKFAAAPLPADAMDLARLRAELAGRPVWLAASTHPGEDAIIAAAHRQLIGGHPNLLTMIAPRHPERGADLARELGAARRGAAQGPPRGAGIWIADTLGELGLLFRLAPVVFIGGSLVPRGGQNPLEAARLGCAIAMGPHVENQAESVGALAAVGALVTVADGAALTHFVDTMLRDPEGCRAKGRAGQVAANRSDGLPLAVAQELLRAVKRDVTVSFERQTG
jgi:3-deoxy-D-manno-octulosonic-acid transferase